jgi:hypothetical protein
MLVPISHVGLLRVEHHIPSQFLVVLVEESCHQLDVSHLFHVIDCYRLQDLKVSHILKGSRGELNFIRSTPQGGVKLWEGGGVSSCDVVGEPQLGGLWGCSCLSLIPVVRVFLIGDMEGSGTVLGGDHVLTDVVQDFSLIEEVRKVRGWSPGAIQNRGNS